MLLRGRLKFKHLSAGLLILLFLLIVNQLSQCIERISVAYSFHYTNVRNTAIISDNNALSNQPRCLNQNNVVDKCEVLHICMVCAGAAATRRATTLIKSLLFQRRNPLHVHFIVDSRSHVILNTLFNTWTLPAVNVSFYDSEPYLDRVSWISNRHYSGVYGLLKLILPDILPPSLEKVLVLDTDVLIVTDLSNLWSFWHKMGAQQALGLVDNQSPWYLGHLWKGQIVWPAIGRGYNTGVILLHLNRLRAIDWMQKWKSVALKNLAAFGSTALADQDIFNAVIKEHPSIVFDLPCEWNLQLGDRSQQNQLCPAHPADIKVIHWNSPQKTRIRNRYAEFFRRHYQTSVDMDGSLFRSELIQCSGNINWNLSSSAPIDINDLSNDHQSSQYDYDYDEDGCYEYRRAAKHIYRTHLFYRHFKMDTNAYFPINYLRNVALSNSQTSHVFLVDIDFMPMIDLHDRLIAALVAEQDMQRKALVVPAFESQRYRLADMPGSKEELLNQLDTGQLSVFREEVWVKGHAQTDYDKWRTANKPYSVGWRGDYEPYIVVSKDVPLYDPRFVGFGWNKVSHIMQLDSLGYDFLVLPDVFVVHLPHAPSFDIAQYRSSAQYRKCLKLIKAEFIKHLTKQRKHRTRVAPVEATPVNVE